MSYFSDFGDSEDEIENPSGSAHMKPQCRVRMRGQQEIEKRIMRDFSDFGDSEDEIMYPPGHPHWNSQFLQEESYNPNPLGSQKSVRGPIFQPGDSFHGNKITNSKTKKGQSSKGDIDPKLVLQCYGRELDRDDLCDFTVVVEGKNFKCHRFVLSACSDFFQRLLRSDMKENRSGTANLEGVSCEAFRLILNVIYRGETVLTGDNVLMLWQAATHLQITFLIAACEDFAVAHMSPQDVLQIHLMAETLDSKTVLEATREMMAQHFVDIVQNDCFLQLTFGELSEIMKKCISQTTDITLYPPIYHNVQRNDFQLRRKVKNIGHRKKQVEFRNYPLKANNDIVVKAAMFWVTGKHEYRVSEGDAAFSSQPDSPVVKVDTKSRSKFLKELLETACIGEASTDCIKCLMRDDIVMKNKDVRGLVVSVSMDRMS